MPANPFVVPDDKQFKIIALITSPYSPFNFILTSDFDVDWQEHRQR